MKFESKKDTWLGLLLWGLTTPFFILSIIAQEWVATMIMFITLVLCGWFWFGTYYVFEDKGLLIRCGPVRVVVPYEQIKSIKKTRDIISSAALSLDRLKIVYGRNKMVWISPKSEDVFLSLLKEKSPQLD